MVKLYGMILLLIGMQIGYLIANILMSRVRSGYLRIDTSDPDGPFLFLELSRDLEEVQKQKDILLTVRVENLERATRD